MDDWHRHMLALAASASLLVFQQAVAAESVSLDIPSQRLSQSLLDYSQATGIKILFKEESTSGRNAPAIKGVYDAEQALKTLLEGSGLKYRFTSPTAVVLNPAPESRLNNQALPPNTMPAVTVTGTSASNMDTTYQAGNSTAGSKMPLEITRVPQSIQVITKAAIEDQGAFSIGNILKQVPSATVIGTRFSRFPRINIRGFKADQTRNGIRQIFGGDGDWSALSHIQSVEVLKGPGSTVFGQQTNEGGGIINVVTKRSHKDRQLEFSFARGGYEGFDGDITSGRWDINTPLTADGALTARFTGEIEGSESFIDFQNLDRENFGFAMAWDDGGPVRAYINAEYANRRTQPNPGLPVFGTITGGGLGNISHNTFLGEPNLDRLEAETPLVQAWLEIDLAENWKISPRFQYDEFNIDQDQTFLGNATADLATGRINVARSGRSGFKERDRSFIGQIDITGKVQTGFLTHQIFIGGDYTKGYFATSSQNRIGVNTIDASNPSYASRPFALSPVFQGSEGDFDLGSFAFQDVISIGDKFDLMGGVRHSVYSVKRFTPSTGVTSELDTDNTSYQIGGTFHLTDHIHVFAGYGEGFSPTPAINILAGGKSLEPGESEQIETGVKVNFPGGLTGSASYFESTRKKVTTPDQLNPGFVIQTGEISTRGAETDLSYPLTDQWFVQAGYAFIDAKITSSNAGDVGNEPEKIPEHQANFWTHYKFDSGLLKNLTLSAGANYVGNRPFNNANTVNLPEYTTVDLGASYAYNQVKLELFVNNLLDKRYFVSADFGPAVFPGDPRTIYGRISYRF
ncbi:TonB-dependent siderophore receptor [Methylomonas methanica]|uniref:TonB-dependent siderophore receptor n=1 Tax=Methylomonas methanica (strain DSM 25384 / MC09) TaxID=857087 RepID=G0A113_METMM|nr:TonB-dependent receptor [Methylomonas methanica]AEG01269.1 TonB-dependent siderophore receptor [Methylomonas methanica MC09]